MTESLVNNAIVPTPKLEADFYDWYARHDEKCRLVAERQDYGVVFIGDSITHLFEADEQGGARGGRIWRQELAPYRPLNLGFGWDRTQNVLWRLAHGEFAGLRPRAVVLLIGTNNLTGTANARTSTPAEVVAGTAAICDWLHAASPDTTIILLAVLPRSSPADPLREAIRQVNAGVEEWLAARTAGQGAGAGKEGAVGVIRHLDIGAHFVDAEGRIPAALMNDGVHPTEAGYRIWADAVLSEFATLFPSR